MCGNGQLQKTNISKWSQDFTYYLCLTWTVNANSLKTKQSGYWRNVFNWLPPFFCKQNILLFVQPRWQPRMVFPVSVIKYFGEGAMSYIGSPRASHARFHTSLNCSSASIYTVMQKKGTTFLLWLNLLIQNVIWQNLVLLLSTNIIVDVTYLISGIYTNFRTFLCQKSMKWDITSLTMVFREEDLSTG